MNYIGEKSEYEKIAHEVVNYIDHVAPGEQWGNVYYKNRWDHYRDLIDHNETRVAFEDLAGIIGEDLELRLPEEVYNKLVEVCRFFHVTTEYWENIKYAPDDNPNI